MVGALATPPRTSSWSWNQHTGEREAISRPGAAPARSSMSALDDRNADRMRASLLEYMTARPTRGSTADFGTQATKNPQESRRLPSALSTRYHRRRASESAPLRASRNHVDHLLKPPTRSFRPTSTPNMAAPAAPIAVHPSPVQSDHDFVARTQRASARMHAVPGAHALPGSLTGPPTDIRVRQEARPAPPFQQRRMSSASNASTAASYVSSRETLDSRPRSTSFSSQASFESHASPFSSTYTSPYASPRSPTHPHYQLQVGYTSWARPQSLKQYRRRAKPGEIFAELPGEVLDLILAHLKELHLASKATSCATCWMRDCCSVALSARKFLKHARLALYEDIQLNGQEGPHMKKRMKGMSQSHGRLVLLRRSLRANAQIAALVHTLKVPSMIPASSNVEAYHNLVASVVMACPNFERLAGFYPGYDHSFSRLFHALSTRTKLKELHWVIEPSPFQRQHRIRASGSNFLTPGDLQPFQSASFLDLHANWQQLTSLALYCLPGATLTPDTMLDNIFRRLPSLRKLYLSHLPPTAFNNGSLLALPALQHLTLASLLGVTTAGLSCFATVPASASITSLSLLHMDVDSLPALARIFSNLRALGSFSLVQSTPPIMPSDELIWLFPYLAAGSMTKLHWDIPHQPTRASPADTILAKSISAGGFPALSWLRAPNDPEGVFQELCRPRERADNPSDRYRGNRHYGHGRTTSSVSHGHSHSGSVASVGLGPGKSPTSPGFPTETMMLPRNHSDLREARIAAQARLDAARRFPRYFVNVTDEDGTLVDKYGIGSFIGTVGSKIRYVLIPDAGATDEGGGLVGIAEVLGDCGEDLYARPKEKEREKEKESRNQLKKDKAGEEVQIREGCVGRWNCQNGPPDKKEKDRWMHTERGRWRDVSIF